MPETDYYKTLGISKNTSDEEIKKGLETLAGSKGGDDALIESIKDHDGHLLMLAMKVIRKLLP